MRNSGIEEVEKNCKTISWLLSRLDIFDISNEHINLLREALDAIESLLDKRLEECYKEADSNGKSVSNDETYRLHRRLSLLSNFRDYLESVEVNAAISPYVLLTGDGGTGKSHLIADFIEGQTNSGMLSLLILGRQITSGINIISELPTFLGCDMTYHDLFGSLESIACSQHNRVVICIDALNEGAGVNYWNSSLAELVEFLKDYPHIGLVVSVRTQYELYLFEGQSDLQESLIRVQHNGFSLVTYDAIYKYFDFYGITTDSVVLPDSEFSNPLFQRVFCVANKGRHVSLNDISLPDVYKKYIDEIERKVADSFGCKRHTNWCKRHWIN